MPKAQSVLSLMLTEALGESLLASLGDALRELVPWAVPGSELLTELLADSSASATVESPDSAASVLDATLVRAMGAATGPAVAAASTIPVSVEDPTILQTGAAMIRLPSAMSLTTVHPLFTTVHPLFTLWAIV